LKGELETLRQTFGKHFSTTYVDNRLLEFEELLLDNALLKVQNQAFQNGRSGGRLSKKLQNNRFRKVWRLPASMNEPTKMNWLHTNCISRIISMTTSTAK
jgi:hypothetical protein